MCVEKVTQRLKCASFSSSRIFERHTKEEGEELAVGLVKAISLLISRVQRIQIEVQAEALQTNAPETPKDLIECDPTVFRKLIEEQGSRLRSRFGPTVCNDIWLERNKLISRYSEDSAFRRRVDGVNNLPFGEAWQQLDGKVARSRLLAFIAGLASRAPETHTVEGDFSSLKQAKNSQRACLSNYAMEGQLQAKQYFELLALVSRIQSQVREEKSLT